MLKISENLNLILPIERASDGRKMYVHAMPVSREVFDTYFLVIGQTFTMITAGKLGIVSGPRLAWRLLRKAAMDLGQWEGADGVEQGFMGEVIRMANLVAPPAVAAPAPPGMNGYGGWEPIPLENALNQGMLDEEDRDMVLNALAFFTVSSLMLPRRMNGEDFRKDYLVGASKLWAAQTSSSGLMDFVASLRTSTAAASIGATVGTA